MNKIAPIFPNSITSTRSVVVSWTTLAMACPLLHHGWACLPKALSDQRITLRHSSSHLDSHRTAIRLELSLLGSRNAEQTTYKCPLSTSRPCNSTTQEATTNRAVATRSWPRPGKSTLKRSFPFKMFPVRFTLWPVFKTRQISSEARASNRKLSCRRGMI